MYYGNIQTFNISICATINNYILRIAQFYLYTMYNIHKINLFENYINGFRETFNTVEIMIPKTIIQLKRLR